MERPAIPVPMTVQSSCTGREASGMCTEEPWQHCLEVGVWVCERVRVKTVFCSLCFRRACLWNLLWCLRGATALLVAALQPRLRLAVVQAKYCNSFQSMHIPRGNQAQSIVSNGDQKEDKTLLQHSQLHQQGEFLACKRQ